LFGQDSVQYVYGDNDLKIKMFGHFMDHGGTLLNLINDYRGSDSVKKQLDLNKEVTVQLDSKIVLEFNSLLEYVEFRDRETVILKVEKIGRQLIVEDHYSRDERITYQRNLFRVKSVKISAINDPEHYYVLPLTRQNNNKTHEAIKNTDYELIEKYKKLYILYKL